MMFCNNQNDYSQWELTIFYGSLAMYSMLTSIISQPVAVRPLISNHGYASRNGVSVRDGLMHAVRPLQISGRTYKTYTTRNSKPRFVRFVRYVQCQRLRIRTIILSNKFITTIGWVVFRVFLIFIIYN